MKRNGYWGKIITTTVLSFTFNSTSLSQINFLNLISFIVHSCSLLLKLNNYYKRKYFIVVVIATNEMKVHFVVTFILHPSYVKNKFFGHICTTDCVYIYVPEIWGLPSTHNYFTLEYSFDTSSESVLTESYIESDNIIIYNPI